MTELIDVHAHFLTPEYVAAARAAGMEHPDGMPGWPAWSLAQQLAEMDDHGIRRALLSISSPGVAFAEDRAADLARSINDEGAAHRGAHPERLGLLASLPLPDVDAAVREARRAFGELDAEGVILESNARGQYLGDEDLEPLWEELARRRAIVLVHPTTPVDGERTALGYPRPMLEFMVDSSRTIIDLVLSGVLERHPDLRIVVPHAGAVLPILSQRIELISGFAIDGDVPSWTDAMRTLWFDMAGTPFPHCVPVLADVAGTEHIVYGSDSCWTPAETVTQQIASIEAAEPPAGFSDWRTLTSRNARALLSR